MAEPRQALGAMAKVINLNRARKQRLREQAQARAAENRLRHGLSKVERARLDAEAAAAADKLAGLRREPSPPPDPDERE